MADLRFSACAEHQAIHRMDFDRAIVIAVDCPDCVVERTSDIAHSERMSHLLAEYDHAKGEADAAAERLKTITDGIKAEAINAAGVGATEVFLSDVGLRQPLRLAWVESWRLNTTKLKTEEPELYVRYAKKGGSWQLRRVTP